MGCFGSKDKLSKEDMDFLKSHTRYDEATIKEWYKGFKVSATTRKKKLFFFLVLYAPVFTSIQCTNLGHNFYELGYAFTGYFSLGFNAKLSRV